MFGMENLDHKTAAVIIPPEDVWGPIQAIRQKHDRMNHETPVVSRGQEATAGIPS